MKIFDTLDGEQKQNRAAFKWKHMRAGTARLWVRGQLLWCSLFAQQDAEASLNRFFAPVTSLQWDMNGQGQIWGYSGSRIPGELTQIITNATSAADVAETLGMSSITLRRSLAEICVSLREFRLECSLNLRKKLKVQEIQTYIDTHPGCSRSDIYRDCKTAVGWLQQHPPLRIAIILPKINDHRLYRLKLKF